MYSHDKRMHIMIYLQLASDGNTIFCVRYNLFEKLYVRNKYDENSLSSAFTVLELSKSNEQLPANYPLQDKNDLCKCTTRRPSGGE